MLKRRIYDEDHEMFRESVRRFLLAEAVPYHDAWEEAGITPREFWLKAGEQGLLCPQVPEDYGGPGGDYRYLAIVQEEMMLLGITGPNFAVHSDICGEYVLKYGTEEQKKQWLPKFVSGEAICAIAMTEPNAGSDLQAIRTTAIRDGDDYVINGSKIFISNGQNADVIILAAKTDPAERARGMSLILVESSRAGYAKGKNLAKLGLKAQDTSELFFQDLRAPATNLLGGEGQGFFNMMAELPQERLAVAVAAVAAMQRALDLTVDYTRERKAFGKPVLDFQNTRFVLADVTAEVQAGWCLLDAAITAHLEGGLSADDAAILKLWTTERQGTVIDQCLQLFGGYGYMLEYPIARMFRDARVQRIYGGSSEIMKEIIGRTL